MSVHNSKHAGGSNSAASATDSSTANTSIANKSAVSAAKRPVVKHFAPNQSAVNSSFDKVSAINSSTDFESQDAAIPSKRSKSNNAPGADVRCPGAPPFVSAVLHLLSQPLAPLLCSERYKRYLQREQAFVALREDYKVNTSLLVGLPPVMSRLLNSRSSRSGFVVSLPSLSRRHRGCLMALRPEEHFPQPPMRLQSSRPCWSRCAVTTTTSPTYMILTEKQIWSPCFRLHL